MSAVIAVIVSGVFTLAVAIATAWAGRRTASEQTGVDSRRQQSEEWEAIRKGLREELDHCTVERDVARREATSMRIERDAALDALEQAYRVGGHPEDGVL